MGRFDLRTRNGLIYPIIQGLQGGLLLDIYPTASLAYSLRLLRSVYTGSAIRVRRSSDNTEQDIGFTSFGVLDTSALLTFCGVGNGFVTKFYDQSGSGNDAAQTTAANQPIIVSAGVLITRNGKPYMQASSTQWLVFTTEITAANNTSYSMWMPYEKDTSGNQAIILKDATNYHWLDYGFNQYINNVNFITISSANAINTLYLINTITDYSNTSVFYRNGTSIGTRGASTAGATSKNLPAGSLRSAKITMTEFIYYPNTQTSNQVAISTNINIYYGIY